MHGVVVTGTSTGIGAATVAALANAGFITYAGVRNETDAERVRAVHPNVRAVLLDVTNPAAIEAAVQALRAEGIPLRALVNNAGVAVAGPLESIPIDELRHQFEVNVIGAVAVTQAFLPLLRSAREARVVFVGSVSGHIAVPYIAPYSASKFALRAIADAMRVELAPSGVQVALVEPGSVKTPIWSKGRGQRDLMMSRIREGMPEYYRSAIEAVIRTTEAEEGAGLSAGSVADVIVRAVTVKRAAPHTIVGAAARIGAALAVLPAALHDRLLRATMRLP